MHDEFQLLAKLSQQRDITPPLMAKGESAADTDAIDIFEIAGEITDELIGGDFAEGAVESNQPGGMCSHRVQDTKLLRERINQERRFRGGDNRVGMPVESDRDCEAFVLAGIGDGLADDLLMSEVNAVENADCHTDFAGAWIQFAGAMDQLHW